MTKATRKTNRRRHTKRTERQRAQSVLARVQSDLCDIETAAAVLGVSVWLARAMAAKGDIKAVRCGRLLRISVESLRSFVGAG